MKPFHRTPVIEAGMIVMAALLLSFMFTGIMGKGLFRVLPASNDSRAPEAVGSTFLTYDEALGLYLRKRALFIDARYAYDFVAGHIRGAVSIPLHEFDKNHPILTVLPKDQMLVVYCDGVGCNSSAELAKMLHGFGYANVKVFFGGWNEWLAHKQPTEP
jgi:rhodanese-related sulfurtransferase